MNIRFFGQVAVVTGGGGGIGRATALAFAAQGIKVMVSDVDAGVGNDTVGLIHQHGWEAQFIACDVTDEAQVAAFMDATIARFGRLDYAFNNAGIMPEVARLADGSAAEFDTVMAINVKGVWLCMKYQLPIMLAQQGGVIVNTASITGLRGAAGTSVYSASKHAVIGLTKSAAKECAKKGIRINAICPSVTDTAMVSRSLETNPNPKAAEYLKQIHPMGRIGTADEMAAAVLYLCSDLAAFTVGHTLVVEGGATA